MNHTPGPWKIIHDSPPAIRDSGGNNVCPEVSHMADTRLIAAAPDLLELAHAFISYLEDDSRSPRRRKIYVAMARIAIAKATGEAS